MNVKTFASMAALTGLFSCVSQEQAPASKAEAKTSVVDSQPAKDTANATALPAVTSYSEHLELGSMKFTVTSPQSATGNSITVTPAGLGASNDPITLVVEGLVTKSELGDLDADASPEILVVTRSGPDKKAKAYLFSVNGKNSLGTVPSRDISGDARKMEGNNGQDDYALVESSLVQRFPLFKDGQPTGKTRQFQYKLKKGEASKKLVLDKTVEY
jgi:hypothetical protein